MIQLKKKEDLHFKKNTRLYIIILINLSLVLFYSCNENQKEFLNTNHKNNDNKILLYNENGTLKSYIFLNPNNNDTLFFLDYENNYPILLHEPFDNLIYAQKMNKNGEIIYFAHTPPYLTLETHIVHRDLNGNEHKRDTIYGENIKPIFSAPSENLISIFAVDSDGYAVIEEALILVNKRNYFEDGDIYYKPWLFKNIEDVN